MVAAVSDNMGVPRTSVVGSMLSRFIDKDVRLIGRVSQSGPVNTFQLTTGDNAVVNVKIAGTLDEEVEGLVEVQGKVVSKDSVFADHYIVFPSDLAEKFDLATYSEAVTFTGSCENPWTAQS